MSRNDRTNWAGVRTLDERAVAIGWKTAITGRRCIQVTNARIRGAVVSGYFQVADVLKPESTFGDRQRIEVECYWYGKKPKTTWMNLTINGGCKDVKNYTGDVIADIGRLASS